MLVLSCTLKVKDGAAAALIEQAKMLIPASRAEEGCLRYDLLQDALQPDQFVFFELWRSQADLDAHFRMPHFRAFGKQLGALLEGGPEIVTYESSGGVKLG